MRRKFEWLFVVLFDKNKNLDFTENLTSWL